MPRMVAPQPAFASLILALLPSNDSSFTLKDEEEIDTSALTEANHSKRSSQTEPAETTPNSRLDTALRSIPKSFSTYLIRRSTICFAFLRRRNERPRCAISWSKWAIYKSRPNRLQSQTQWLGRSCEHFKGSQASFWCHWAGPWSCNPLERRLSNLGIKLWVSYT